MNYFHSFGIGVEPESVAAEEVGTQAEGHCGAERPEGVADEMTDKETFGKNHHRQGEIWPIAPDLGDEAVIEKLLRVIGIEVKRNQAVDGASHADGQHTVHKDGYAEDGEGDTLLYHLEFQHKVGASLYLYKIKVRHHYTVPHVGERENLRHGDSPRPFVGKEKEYQRFSYAAEEHQYGEGKERRHLYILLIYADKALILVLDTAEQGVRYTAEHTRDITVEQSVESYGTVIETEGGAVEFLTYHRAEDVVVDGGYYRCREQFRAETEKAPERFTGKSVTRIPPDEKECSRTIECGAQNRLPHKRPYTETGKGEDHTAYSRYYSGEKGDLGGCLEIKINHKNRAARGGERGDYKSETIDADNLCKQRLIVELRNPRGCQKEDGIDRQRHGGVNEKHGGYVALRAVLALHEGTGETAVDKNVGYPYEDGQHPYQAVFARSKDTRQDQRDSELHELARVALGHRPPYPFHRQ